MNLGGLFARRESEGISDKRNYHSIEKFLILCLILSSSLSDLGKIYEWDMCAASTNPNYKKNIVEATSGDNARFVSLCDTTYAAESYLSVCTASFYGLFVNHNATGFTDVGSILKMLAISQTTRFQDHSTNTLLTRTYLNPSKITSNAKLPFMFMGACAPLPPDCNGFGFGFQYSSSDGSIQPLGYKGYDTGQFGSVTTFADGIAPILDTASWVDFSVSLTSSGASSTARLTFKSYMQNEEFDSGEVNVGEIKSGFSMSTTSLFSLVFFNGHAMDATILYISVYGGSKSYEYIEESYGLTPPGGLDVPPEYCSDASTEFLLKGCTNKIGKKCKPKANCRCKDTKTKYQHELEAKEIAGIAIGVSLGVDIALMMTIFLCIFI